MKSQSFQGGFHCLNVPTSRLKRAVDIFIFDLLNMIGIELCKFPFVTQVRDVAPGPSVLKAKSVFLWWLALDYSLMSKSYVSELRMSWRHLWIRMQWNMWALFQRINLLSSKWDVYVRMWSRVSIFPLQRRWSLFL